MPTLRQDIVEHMSTELEVCKDFVLSHSPDLFDVSSASKYQNHLLNQLWDSRTCRNYQFWLDWPLPGEDGSSREDNLGPAMFHRAPVSRFAMHLLTSNSTSASISLVPLHISLGRLEEQTQQVNLMSRHLWCHSATLSSPRFDIRYLEKLFLIQAFKKLMEALHPLLLSEEETSWNAALANLQSSCGDNIAALKELQNVFETRSFVLTRQIAEEVSSCFKLLKEALDANDSDLMVPAVGHGLVSVGLVLAHLLSPKGPVDPVEKAGLKQRHFVKEAAEVDTELDTWSMYLDMTTGRKLSETPAEHLHPRVTALLQRRQVLKDMISNLEKCSAYRPDQVQYNQLSQAISNFMDNTCSTSRVLDLVTKLKLTSNPRTLQGEATLVTSLQEERVWQDTTSRFLKQVQQTFECYRDIVLPFVASVHKIKFGMRLMAQHVDLVLKANKFGSTQKMTSLVQRLCSFPTIASPAPDLLSLANQLSTDIISTIDSCKEDKESNDHTVKSRLLLCALILLKAHSLTSGQMDQDMIGVLSRVLDQFTTAWLEQEERKRLKEAEEATYYKYKDQVHGDERSEKEREEADFKASYPSFETDFIDVTGADKLEDIGLEAGGPKTEEPSRVTLEGISNVEMVQVCAIHNDILTSLSQADWLDKPVPDPAAVTDILTSSLMSYQIGADVVKTTFGVLCPEVDQSITGSHLVIGGSVLQYLDAPNSTAIEQVSYESKKCTKSYNIYYDANVPEVIKCKPVLDSLKKRVEELQQEWPDHPTLKLLNQIMDRILTFSVTNPVIKFLTGLELLLQKAQDWESNAACYVSLSTQLTEITSVIVDWRKLELSCWSSSLDREEEKCKEKASQWWFHLYQLTSDFLTGNELVAYNKDQKTKVDTLESLKKFMEGATVGEYQVRLQMLLAFHCQVLHMEKCPAQKKLLYMLWNVYQFYKQYLPTIQGEIKKMRTPIDKQLKGFVKIARWSDMNYWALKTSTEKTHRTVHKYIKEYQTVLNQPVKTVLGDKGDDLVSQAVKQTEGFSIEEKIAVFTKAVLENLNKIISGDLKSFSAPSNLIGLLSLLPRVPTLYKKMKSHLQTCIAESKYAKEMLIFDGFTGELIQEMHELQALHVDAAAEKEKQKTEARSVNLRKRKGLSELFKYLSLIGLSYRKGVTGKNTMVLTEALELPPLNLNSHATLPVCSLWTGSESYFYRCISRHAQFASAIISPSKELSMGDTERCRGFIEHFSQLYVDQRIRLADLTFGYLSLRKVLQSLKTLEELSSYNLPPQAQSHSWLARIKQLTTRLLQGLAQFALVLEFCPSSQLESSLTSVHPSPLPTVELSQSALWFKGDAAWTHCYELVQTLQKEVKEEQIKVDRILEKSVLGRSDMSTVSKTLQVYESLTGHFADISSQFTDPSGSSSCLVSSLTFLSSEVLSLKQQFFHWWDSLHVEQDLPEPEDQPIQTVPGLSLRSGKVLPQSPLVRARLTDNVSCGELSKDFLQRVESCVQSVLLSVQNVIKVQQKNTRLGQEEDSNGVGLEDELKDAHLTKHLLDMEKNTVTNLNCSKVTTMLEGLMSSLCTISDTTDKTTTNSSEAKESVPLCVQSLLQAQPLVAAFSSLVEHQLGHSLALHRSMGKLLSVLLAVFTELAQKGFCIPPELSEEADGEGATEFKDIEGGGLGEGEGAKDVSDQIESEDQLDEAKRPGQEEKEKPKEEPEIPSEDNAIEMSDDFDGKLHDNDDTEKGEDDEDDAKEEDEMDKQMGEADGEDNDRLDDRMWGSDEEEEEDEQEESKDDKNGGGMDRQKEEMVAKEENKGETEGQESDDQQDKDEKTSDQPQDLMEEDEDYDDNQVNPHNPEEEKEAEDLNLPEDLKLDEGDRKDKGWSASDTQMCLSLFDNNFFVKCFCLQDQPGADENGEESIDNKEEEDAGNKKAEKEEEEEGEGEEEGTNGPSFDFCSFGCFHNLKEEEKPTAELRRDKEDNPTQDKVETVDSGQTSQTPDAADSKQGDADQEEAADKHEDDQEEKEGVGAASSEDQDGHIGQKSSQTTDGSAPQAQKKIQRNPGQSDNDRSLGSHEKEHRRLKTKDKSETLDKETEENEAKEEAVSKEYEHVKDAKSHADGQTVDVANKEQMQEKQAVPTQMEGDELLEEEEDMKMEDEDTEDLVSGSCGWNEFLINTSKVNEKRPVESKEKVDTDKESGENASMERENVTVEGERVLTMTAERPPESTIHTQIENLHLDFLNQDVDIDDLRRELEENVQLWSHPEEMEADVVHAASEAWQKYLAITGPLSQELCEQLRLILEPSQATKLKGDYRTGKRLNMRKVIPYIASQFRKDKIWLRRSKPSKRQYQIMIAVDDSASMADNHSKQLAFESLALVSNALTLLESGELAVCSFGEEVRLLHPFSEPFTNQSGARILQQLSCEQKQTKYGMLLDKAMALMLDARSRQPFTVSNADTAQLLLVLSDGHGVFREGMDFVRRAVRRARASRIFLVFVIMDNPEKKGSILDARVPLMDSTGKIQEIKSYMEMFPFPFYIILRDIGSMPQILSDALRQWFELVTASDR
ncbi:unnamed protein product [Lymnaea stagnalis]|uniref:VWFA domain-containing protein n=1 Tax=Lymnaea stagnalis TaxID=6523 RepID=A0AAV2HKS7_LYMST